jgi:hypothetical protein
MSSAPLPKVRPSVLTLAPGDEPSPEQAVQAVNGQLRILREGHRIGFSLSPKDRPLFLAAVQQRYLLQPVVHARLVEAFLWWCEAKGIPCVRFQIEQDCLEMVPTDDHAAAEDPWVRVHLSMDTTGRVFTKAGLLAAAGVLFDYLSDVALTPWDISAGTLPLRMAQRLVGKLLEMSRIPEMTTTDEEGPPPGRRDTVH